MDSLGPAHLMHTFNRREVEILRLMKEGLSNHTIAQNVSLSLETVKWYNQQIFGKLGVNNRTQAVEKAIQIGLIEGWISQPGLQEGIPPLAANPRHNLPVPLTAFIGRKKECAELRTLLHGSATRLVTILGAGGVGKTRLALRVAEEAAPSFTHGVWLVDLSPVIDPELVPQFVAKGLGIHDSGGRSFEAALLRYLSSKSILLLIDNCEHLASACALLLSHLLPFCPHLRALVTSREALGLEGEAHYVLSPLSYPDPKHLPELKMLRCYDAVQLFVDRTNLVHSGFTLTEENARAIARVCWSVEGIPLALELAAARTSLFSVEQIAERLEDCFSVLSPSEHPVIARFHTMRAVLDWSFCLLTEPEQALLRRLGVFIGGWTFEAAERICAEENSPPMVDLLNQMVNKSLVIAYPNIVATPELKSVQQSRYRLLEPIRQYALEKAGQFGEIDWLFDRHLAYFREMAERTMTRPFQRRWNRQYKFLKHDLENIRKALDWGLRADPGSPRLEDGLRLISALGPFWGQGGFNREGVAWLIRAISIAENLGLSHSSLRAHLLDECGFLFYMQADYHTSRRLLEESVALFRQCGDDWNLIMPLTHLSVCCSHIDQPRSLVAGDESVAIARRVGDPLILAEALFWRGEVAQKCGDPQAALPLGQESLDLFLRLGEEGEACRPIVLLWIYTYTLHREDTETIIHYHDTFQRHRQGMEDNGFEYYVSGIEFITSYFLGNYSEMEATLRTLLDQNLDQNQAPAIWYARDLGVALKCLGKYHEGADRSYQSLLLAQEVNNVYGMCCALANIADIAAIARKPYCSAMLLGAVDQFLKSISRWLEMGPDIDCFEHGAATARAAISAVEFAREWEKGQRLTLVSAVQEARLIVEELAH